MPRKKLVPTARRPVSKFENYVLIGVKAPPELQKRLRVACAEDGLSYWQMIDYLLDVRDRYLERQRAGQAHPLSQPGVNSRLEVARIRAEAVEAGRNL